MRRKQDSPVLLPFTIAIDTREQLPYSFAGFCADAKDGGGPLLVGTERVTLKSGDYGIIDRTAYAGPPNDGWIRRIAIERKSPQDFFHTLGQDRSRFERELERLNELDFAKVVVEAEWSAILDTDGPMSSLGVISQLKPKTAWRSVLAWQQRFPRVHWDFVPGRDFGEATTLRTLERYWKERQS